MRQYYDPANRGPDAAFDLAADWGDPMTTSDQLIALSGRSARSWTRALRPLSCPFASGPLCASAPSAEEFHCSRRVLARVARLPVPVHRS